MTNWIFIEPKSNYCSLCWRSASMPKKCFSLFSNRKLFPSSFSLGIVFQLNFDRFLIGYVGSVSNCYCILKNCWHTRLMDLKTNSSLISLLKYIFSPEKIIIMKQTLLFNTHLPPQARAINWTTNLLWAKKKKKEKQQQQKMVRRKFGFSWKSRVPQLIAVQSPKDTVSL